MEFPTIPNDVLMNMNGMGNISQVILSARKDQEGLQNKKRHDLSITIKEGILGSPLNTMKLK
jgi:hypothetical protein